MISSANNKVLVSVDMEQKSTMQIGAEIFHTATMWDKNYRERSPVIGRIEEDTEFLRKGQVAIFHHNNFYLPSPYHLYDNLFSVPMGKTIFGTLDDYGYLSPTFGNMICDRVEVSGTLLLPVEEKLYHINRYVVIDGGWTMFKRGDIVFTRPHSGYEIVYILDNVENRVVKVDSEMVCGVVKNKFV